MKKAMTAIVLLLLSVTKAWGTEEIQTINTKLEALTAEIESLKSNSKNSKRRLNFGGYGEFTYNNKRSEREDGAKVAHTKNPELDAQRFILYISYDFENDWKLISEIELEHANSIFLEQGYIQKTFSDYLQFQVGVLLVPVGLTNLYHEPTTFHGVERPGLDNKIIPTTWRELGFGFSGQADRLKYKAYLVNGLDGSKFSSSGVRSGRKKASSAQAKALSFVFRGDYSILPSFDLGASLYLGKADGTQTNVKHTIWDVHFSGDVKGITLKGVYSQTKISDALKLNNEFGNTGSSSIAEEMKGYYVEVGYDVLHQRSQSRLIPFIRYEQYNTQDKLATGFTKDLSKDVTNITYGLNYFPVKNIVFKADYMKSKNKAKTGYDTWSLGVGWNF